MAGEPPHAPPPRPPPGRGGGGLSAPIPAPRQRPPTPPILPRELGGRQEGDAPAPGVPRRRRRPPLVGAPPTPPPGGRRAARAAGDRRRRGRRGFRGERALPPRPRAPRPRVQRARPAHRRRLGAPRGGGADDDPGRAAALGVIFLSLKSPSGDKSDRRFPCARS